MGHDELSAAVEIVKDVLYFVCVRHPDSLRYSALAQQHVCFSVDAELIYEPFFADFGPLNLGQSYRFCERVLAEQQRAEGGSRRLYLYTCADPHKKANAAVLAGLYGILYHDLSAEEAYRPLLALKPFVPFRDASCGASTFHLTVLDCLRAVEKAKKVGFIDFHRPDGRFSIEEYEHYEQVENGDLNWIIPGKAIAFSGPSAKRTEFCGYRTLVPEDYWDFYRRAGVSAIIRLNKKLYEKRRFTDAGFNHHDMYFQDGSCPSDQILRRFLETVEKEPGVVCVHCKAGLGRTGVLLGCYIMKHYKFTANEVIGYLRICRPGSVIGPQQHFLRDQQERMWKAGDMHRQQKAMFAAGGPEAPLAAAGAPEGPATPTRDAEVPQGLGRSASSSASPVKPMHSGTRPSSRAVETPITGRLRVPLRGPAPPTPGAHGLLGRGSTPVSSSAAGATVGAQARRYMTATLHTDTVQHAASRPALGISGLGTSSDPLARTIHSMAPPPVSSAGKPGTAGRLASGPASPPQQGQYRVQRVLAPNGQPRKVATTQAATGVGPYGAGPVRSALQLGQGVSIGNPYSSRVGLGPRR